jgi:hypothetical protein
MGNPLNVDAENMRQKARELEDAAKQYYAKGTLPFSEQIAALDAMNTDFLAKFKTMLKNANNANPNLNYAVVGLTRTIADTLEEVDEKSASEMSAGKER